VYQGTHDHDLVRRRQPYEIELDGIALLVDKEVFPPDVGTVTRNMGRELSRYAPTATAACDVGCGTGFLAVVMRRLGCPDVWALDIHPAAVACCRKNVERNAPLGPIEVRQSDLFSNVPIGKSFDLVTFHQPYFPSTGGQWIAATADGGREVIVRFLEQVGRHLAPQGKIMMAFQNTAGPENDPGPIAEELGHTASAIWREDAGTISKFIYEIRYGFGQG
jgi:release factor glutamine methyltransferase